MPRKLIVPTVLALFVGSGFVSAQDLPPAKPLEPTGIRMTYGFAGNEPAPFSSVAPTVPAGQREVDVVQQRIIERAVQQAAARKARIAERRRLGISLSRPNISNQQRYGVPRIEGHYRFQIETNRPDRR